MVQTGYTVGTHKRKPGRPGINWMVIVRQDLKDMSTTCDEVEELATNRVEWPNECSPSGCGMN